MASDMKASIHRFRLRRTSPAPANHRTSIRGDARTSDASGRGRSASPPSPSAPLRQPRRSRAANPSPATSTSRQAPPDPDTLALRREEKEGQRESQSQSQREREREREKPSLPACDRCRSFKKKCSRTLPVCALCANAGQKCSYSSPIASAEAQAHILRQRVEWLSRYINENLMPPGQEEDGGVEALETGADLAAMLGGPHLVPEPSVTPSLELVANGPAAGLVLGQDEPMIDPTLDAQASLTSPPLDPGLGPGLGPGLDPGSVRAAAAAAAASQLSFQPPADPALQQNPIPITRQALPPDAAARRFVDAYFRNVNRAYPFINQAKIRQDLEVLSEMAQHPRNPHLTLLYLVMAIGCTTLERAGQIRGDTTQRFDVAYSDIIQECLDGESLESIQILVLLSLYSLFDANGTSAYSLVGIAARQAMVLGLTRRAPDHSSLTREDIELRHRLYWSIYVLDRMMAASHGLPTALADQNADVPLPGLTVEEFASAERTTNAKNLQTSRHVIQLRQLEDRILKQVHLRRQADSATWAPGDRRAVLNKIRADIEDWYSNGCLVSPIEIDNVPIHSSITWISARYYHLLVLLYFPNHFNSAAKAISRAELLECAKKQLQSNSALFQQRQLPLNRITLCRFFPVCMIFMLDFSTTFGSSRWAAQATMPFAAREEVALLIGILEAFPEGWGIAHQVAQVMREFAGIIAGGMTSYFGDPNSFSLGVNGGSPGKETIWALMRPCIANLAVLMQQTLGQATAFQHIDFPPEEKVVPRMVSVPLASASASASTSGTQNVTPPNSVYFNGGSAGGGEQADMGGDNLFGWGSWDLDFI